MSNLDAAAEVTTCHECADQARVQVLSPRDVPLGGLRAVPVRRTLPHRDRSFIGAWCFLDHYGPDDVTQVAGMHVAPHPHAGLQTVSWLFSGEIEHNDSIGSPRLVRPGEMNLMTAGRGIAHSEVSTANTTILHGVQLWVVLPDSARHTAPAFEHYAAAPIEVDGGSITVFLGSLAGQTSPVRTFTPLLGAEITVLPHATLTLAVDPSFEHGVLVDSGSVSLAGAELHPAELGFIGHGCDALTVTNLTPEPARAVLLGGTPFHEEVLMWWNFVGRTDDEIRNFRNQWQFEIGAPDGAANESAAFGPVTGYGPGSIPAPPIPPVKLKPRRASR